MLLLVNGLSVSVCGVVENLILWPEIGGVDDFWLCKILLCLVCYRCFEYKFFYLCERMLEIQTYVCVGSLPLL